MVDVYTYFYQDKLRSNMYLEEKELRLKYQLEVKVDKRFENKSSIVRLRRSLFSVIYVILYGMPVLTTAIYMIFRGINHG